MIAVVAAAALAQPAPQMPSLDEAFRIALGKAGLSPQAARFDPSIVPFYRQAEFTIPFFNACYDDVWRIPFLMETQKRELFVASGRPVDQITTASRMLGDGARRQLLGNPAQAALDAAKQPGSLQTALNKMKDQGLISTAIPSTADVPKETAEAAALLIEISLAAKPLRDSAFASIDDLDAEFRRETTTPDNHADPAVHQRLVDLYGKPQMSYLYGAAQELAAAAVEARGLLGSVGAAEYRFTVETSWGVISLTGAGQDSHDGRPSFIRIDTSGNDTYINPASTASAANWASFCIDTDGSDRYLSHADLSTTKIESWPARGAHREALGPAAAAFGIAVLVDSDGSDLYRTARAGLGSAFFGSAILLDTAGDDVYDGYADGQGFAKFGIGILEDLAGDDEYSGFQQVQGVGLTKGAGLLVDRRGRDSYVANTGIVDFPSPQDSNQNVSMSQGAGYGVRSDYLTGKSLSGGVGMLYDVEGDDTYTSAVFGQGTGYWEGIGILWDDKGADRYDGFWYVQGASAHFGLGYLEDGKGNDEYDAARNMAQGAGHDFGPGILLDRDGDDRYTGPNLSQGAGNANGIGVFIDMRGDDIHQARGIAVGQCSEAQPGSLRERALCLGLFMDFGGRDQYPSGFPYATNTESALNWRGKLPTASESQLGIFWDR